MATPCQDHSTVQCADLLNVDNWRNQEPYLRVAERFTIFNSSQLPYSRLSLFYPFER